MHENSVIKEEDKYFNIYDYFLNSKSKSKWETISTKRRAGVVVPLFSIYSNESLGIGEIPDLKFIVDWCKKTNMSIVQLLPLNDTGCFFSPYDSESSFALDPMYLSINKLIAINLEPFQSKIKALKEKYSIKNQTVNYKIKNEKLKLLLEIYKEFNINSNDNFNEFKKENAFWLNDYCKFKALKKENKNLSWEKWSLPLLPSHLETNFFSWIQWQLYLQMKEIKSYANQNNVLIMGDLPFLVSRDSADVWSSKKYFHLNLISGAPPDSFNDKGQRWGMPLYNWVEIENDNYKYLKEKLKYAENFYNLFRVDHFIGLFRIWTIDSNEPLENQGLNGKFNPENESLWKSHGEKILKVMLDSSKMLPCAEDLGVIPLCSYEVIDEYCIPGLDIQRWQKDEYGNFKSEKLYRKNSISSISTHDMYPLLGWWLYEASNHEKSIFLNYLGLNSKLTEKDIEKLIKGSLLKVSNASSIFSIQLINDWLSLTLNENFFKPDFRINTPSTISESNWSLVLPFSLEEINNLEINKIIKEINIQTHRI